MNPARRTTGPTPAVPLRLTLLGRSYCHLCTVMEQALIPLMVAHGFEAEVLEIDDFPELEARYDELVPVLLHGDHELCHYHLDSMAVTAYVTDYYTRQPQTPRVCHTLPSAEENTTESTT